MFSIKCAVLWSSAPQYLSKAETNARRSYWQLLEEMTQLNKSMLMNDACPQSPQSWWRKKAKLSDCWGAVCAWCRTRWVSSQNRTLSFHSSFLFVLHECIQSLTHKFEKKNQFLVELFLYKTPQSLCSHSDLKMVHPNAPFFCRQLLHSLCHPLPLPHFLCSLVVSPSHWASLV